MKIWYFLYICINVTNIILPLCLKKGNIMFSQKNTPKSDISCITGKYYIYPRKYNVLVEILYWLTFKIDIVERAQMALCTFIETFTDVYMYFLPVKDPRKLNV